MYNPRSGRVTIILLAALLLVTAGLIPVSADVLEANFSASPLTGTFPLEVQFTDHSTGSVTSWLWYFGDGASTDLQSPLHEYTSAGNFTVNLTVANSSGSNTLVKADYIRITNPPPAAAFSGSPQTGAVPLNVQFSDLSTGVIFQYLWDFGDGTTSVEQDPLHTYATPGTYNVTLTVTNDGGSNITSAPGYVHATNQPPVASFTANATLGNVPLHIHFTDTSAGQNITSRSWTFGDGGTSTSTELVHTYAVPGTYDVSLTVTNDGGSNTSTRTAYIRVFEEVPVADFIATPLYGGEPLEVQFRDTSLGKVTSWSWQFGDGESSNMQSPAHTYLHPGNYTVSLTVGSSGGTNVTRKADFIQVIQLMPVADFKGEPKNGPVPLSVNFTDHSTGSPSSWLWDFGDGNTSPEQNPSHTYSFPGSFPVSLTVSNTHGTDSKYRGDYIVTGEPPSADFNASTTTPFTNSFIHFNDLSTGSPTSWLWDFGDGTTDDYSNPWHYYSDPGAYTVSLTVSNEWGSDTEVKTEYITVSPSPPEADFYGFPRDGSFPLTVTFYQWSYGGYYENLSYQWDFGDGTPNSTLPDHEIVHTYMQAGVYNVTLTVSANGMSATRQMVNYIGTNSPPPPVAEFTATPRSGTAPLTVSFIDQSSGSPPLSYSWDFGDGELSTDRNPVHRYTTPGVYNVSLSTTNPGGASTEVKTGYITISATDPLLADFTSNVTSGTLPLSVQFIDSSGGNPSSWSWNFESGFYYLLDGVVNSRVYPYGGSLISSEKNPVVTYEYPGNYSVTLTVSRTGETNTMEKNDYIHVYPPPPVADFFAYPTQGTAPLEVEFDAYVPWWYYTNEWTWDFGDGTVITENSPWTYHTYQNPGLYNVTLTVTSPYGTDTQTRTDFINVTRMLPPEPGFAATPLSGNAPLVVSFTDQSSGIVHTRLWDFGDGTSEWANTTPGVAHTYPLPGTYTVTLTVGNDGGEATLAKADYITVNPSGPPPKAQFVLNPGIGTAPLTVSFTDLSTGNPLKWDWNFGDGTRSSERNPTHTYAASGKYTITLTVYNSGGSDTTTRSVMVRAPRVPMAFFLADRSFGSAPMTVHFTDRSLNSPTSWSWDFGDGQISTLQNPTHTYTVKGTFTATLTVANAAGSSSTSRRMYVR